MLHQLAREAPHVLSGGVEGLDGPENGRSIPLQDCAREILERLARDEAEDAQSILFRDPVTRERDKLIKGTERIAHATLGAAGNGEQRVLIGIDLLLLADIPQPRHDLMRLDTAQIKPLAPGDDRREELVALGGGKDELHIGRRFLKGLEERVPGRAREHMAFVDDEDLEPGRDRLELHGVHDRLDVLDLVVARGVELGDVDGAAGGDLAAVLACAAGLDAVPVRAVQRLREDAGGRGLADAARADEQVGVRDAAALDGVAQGADDVLLADNVAEVRRAVLQRQGDVDGFLLFFHGPSCLTSARNRVRAGPGSSCGRASPSSRSRDGRTSSSPWAAGPRSGRRDGAHCPSC